MDATVSGQGRVYQAGGDQIVNQTVLPEAALRPVSERAAPSATVNVPGHRQVFVGRGDELAALEAALGGSGPVVVAAVHGLGGSASPRWPPRCRWRPWPSGPSAGWPLMKAGC
ncbi:hypothetical protein ACIBO5_39290 [Nonomuraea angiospora]|uniref:hypothetical protein n=1 Tax=Nonomuraea angiospora TaxID=46172 RepID=UPI00379F3D09